MNVHATGIFATVLRCVGRTRLRAGASLGVMAVIAALVGCAAPGGPRAGDLVCHSAQQCRVQVTVSCPAAGCRAAVDHPRVFANGNDIVWIVVNGAGQSSAFRREDGIFFKTPDGRKVFRCHREAGGDRYACMNRKDRGTYEYGVALEGSPPVPILDPWVVN